MSGSGGGTRRSGRRSSEPLQRIPVGGSTPAGAEEASQLEDASDLEELEEHEKPKTATGRTGHEQGSGVRPVRAGLDRIKPRVAPVAPDAAATAEPAASPADLDQAAGDRDPLGRAALYSSSNEQAQPALGTFLVECSACRRETPVVAGDLVRLGIPSLHLPFVKRFPSLMKCPACGRRTWVRVRWRL